MVEAVWKSQPVRTIFGRHVTGIPSNPFLRHISMYSSSDVSWNHARRPACLRQKWGCQPTSSPRSRNVSSRSDHAFQGQAGLP